MSSSAVELGDSNGLGPDSSMAVDLEAEGGVRYNMETDDKTLLSSDSNENLPAKDKRIVRKAHRTSKNGGTTEAAAEANSVPHSGTSQDGVAKHGVSTTHKGHRRRRHARGRVQLKKGNCWVTGYFRPKTLRYQHFGDDTESSTGLLVSEWVWPAPTHLPTGQWAAYGHLLHKTMHGTVHYLVLHCIPV